MRDTPNDDVRTNSHSTSVNKTKKDQMSKIMKEQGKKANMGRSKKKKAMGNGEELNPKGTGKGLTSTAQNAPKKRRIATMNSPSNY